MQEVVRPQRRLSGTVVPPGDKSISHRGAILGALAQGVSRLENFQRGADCLATLRCLRLLGVPWRWEDGATLVVEGVGLQGLREPPQVLDCRNSGTTMRLLAGLLSSQPFLSVLTGDRSLRRRPMGRVVEPLRHMGAEVLGRAGGALAPLVIRGGALRGMEHHLHVASAQVKSAILLAGLYAEGETVVWEPAPSRDHTERMLGVMGAPIRLVEGGVAISQASELSPLRLRIPGDFSAAAFFLVAALVHPDAQVRLEGVGLNPTRTGLLEVLAQMGAQIKVENMRQWGPEPVADLVAGSSRLEAVQVEADIIPRMIDEVPLLAVAACFAYGETVIRGAQELRAKESDRLRAMARELRRMGARVEELPDGLRIWGPARLQGAVVDSHGDHRLAMALAVAALAARGETVIRNAQSVVVSYPNFWDHLRAVVSV